MQGFLGVSPKNTSVNTALLTCLLGGTNVGRNQRGIKKKKTNTSAPACQSTAVHVKNRVIHQSSWKSMVVCRALCCWGGTQCVLWGSGAMVQVLCAQQVAAGVVWKLVVAGRAGG